MTSRTFSPAAVTVGGFVYLESDLELFGWLDEELQALFHHAGSWSAGPMPCGMIIKKL